MKIDETLVEKTAHAGDIDGDPVVYIKSWGGLHMFFKSKGKGGKPEAVAVGPHLAVARFLAKENEPKIKWNEEFLVKGEDSLQKSEDDFDNYRNIFFSSLRKSESPILRDHYMLYNVEEEEITLVSADDLIQGIDEDRVPQSSLLRKADLSDEVSLVIMHPAFGHRFRILAKTMPESPITPSHDHTFNDEAEVKNFISSQPFAMISAYTKLRNPEQNAKAHEELMSSLKANGLKYTRMHGKWEGEEEPSLLVHNPDPGLIDQLSHNHHQWAYIMSEGGSHRLHSKPDLSAPHYAVSSTGSGHEAVDEGDNYSEIPLKNGNRFRFCLNMSPVALNKSEPEKVNLIHYSPKADLTVIDPAKQGEGVDYARQQRQGPATPARAYYYIEHMLKPNGLHRPEGLVTTSAKHRYTVNDVDFSKIYDVGADPMHFKGTGDVLQLLKDKGFLGFRNSESSLPHAVGIFHPLSPTKAEALGKAVFNPSAYNKEFHGWISPAGQYHPLNPEESHAMVRVGDNMVKPSTHEGWVAVGTAGSGTAIAHESVLSNPKHPALAELRRRVKTLGTTPMSIIVNKGAAGTHDVDYHENIDPMHFYHSGVIKKKLSGGG